MEVERQVEFCFTFFYSTEILSIDRNMKYKEQLHKFLAPFHEIHYNLSSKSMQIRILKKTRYLNLIATEDYSEHKNVMQQRKLSQLAVQ